MADARVYRVAQVFVVGGDPTVTYSPREERQFELILSDYLEERGRVLVVTGPSKSGKTVLLRRAIPEGVWIAGGQVTDLSQFWRLVVDVAGGWTGESRESARTDTETSGSGSSAQFKPAGVGADATWTDSDSVADTSRHQRSVDRDPMSVGAELLSSAGRALVVDDFHHMLPDVQRGLIRQLKPLVAAGLAVVFAAVPHHAADAVAAEAEMEGRVEHLQIGFWDQAELVEIARKGFGALNLRVSDDLVSELTRHSLRSPHLMQLLCRELVKLNGVREQAPDVVELDPPNDWDSFLMSVAVRFTDDQAYRELVRGPQARKDRIERVLSESGETTDIYGAVMLAIRVTGPIEELPYNTLRDSLRELLDDLPQKEQVTNTLRHMTAIADARARDEHGRLHRDPVLEWQAEKDTLFIADPFFAFRVRFGPHVHYGRARGLTSLPLNLTEAEPNLLSEEPTSGESAPDAGEDD
jgi:hypothetical protein